MRRPGRHFLQIPGPSAVPERVLQAISRQVIDHRGPEFAETGLAALAGLQRIFKTTSPVIIYPSSGTGAWEAALVNTLTPGDRVLMYETGHFAMMWQKLAAKIGLQPEVIGGDWRAGADPQVIEDRLRADPAHETGPSASCITKPPPGRSRRSGRSGRRWTVPGIRLC